MRTNSYKLLAEIMKNALTPITDLYAETTRESLDELASKTKELCDIVMPVYSSENFRETALQLSALYKSLVLTLENPKAPEDSLDFLESIDFQGEYVELTEENCNSINTLLELSNIDAHQQVTPTEKTPTIQFLLSIIIPIIIGLLQLWQNENHYKLDSIESQNIQEQEQERYEQIMQGMSYIIDSLNDLQESQESCPCNHSGVPVPQDEGSTDMPDVQPQGDSVE